MWNTVLSGKVWSGEIINKKKNGEFYYEEMVITPVNGNGSNKTTHFIAIKQDITLRKIWRKICLKVRNGSEDYLKMQPWVFIEPQKVEKF